ncbi:MAG: hypothetical protein PWP51_2864 [Clostridiales bacterium]|jgi:butyryl-CoA dehydrogenase|nr:hypothetical protein [Clostridiales bacterium]MDN5300311.1 hypothetical protein [Clostridiales bacterium]
MNAQKMIETACQFSKEHIAPIAESLDEVNRCPTELIVLMQKEGFFSAPYPVAEGGLGFSQAESWAIVRALSKESAGIGLMYVVHWMAVDVLIKYGSEALKSKYLSDMIRGIKLASYAISEIKAGSDAASMTCQAILTDDSLCLNGNKFFVTNGGFADLFVVAFKTSPEMGTKGISLAVVEREYEGVKISYLANKMGFRSSSTTNLILKDCIIPRSNCIGDINRGYKIALDGLVGGRMGMAALGIAIGEAAMENALLYANKRIAYGKPIAGLYSIQQKAAEMHQLLEAAHALFEKTCTLRDHGDDYSLAASTAKVFTAKAVDKICHEAVQCLGGHGYLKNHAVERYQRDGRLIHIGVGTTEVLEMVIGAQILGRYKSS